MAKYVSDSFLSSGAMENPYYPPAFAIRSASLSPAGAPSRTVSNSIPPHFQEGRSPSPRPYAVTGAPSLPRSPTQRQDRASATQQTLSFAQQDQYHHHQQAQQEQSWSLSPPFTRNTATEHVFVAQIQGWRLYTKHLRENAQGERAHLEADRARMEEVMAEERALWDQERDFLKQRIEDLESQLATAMPAFDQQVLPQGVLDSERPPQNGLSAWNDPQHALPHQSVTTSGPARANGSSAKLIPQESGRNPDGSPFYAPATRHPSRTFDMTHNNDLRVDNMAAPRETPLRVTSKELTRSDFGLQFPPAESPSRDGSGSESIDISLLQPELEGVPIKASAIAPEFVAKVLSPNSSLSPSKPSSPLKRPAAAKHEGGLQRSGSKSKPSTLELIAAPENHRLTMNAGHTPNHSVHKIVFEESGNATPTQSQHLPVNEPMDHDPQDLNVDENGDPDPELRGPLSLSNDPPKDEFFLTELTNKLQEVRKNGPFSPIESSANNGQLKGSSHATTISEVFDNTEETIAIQNDEDDKGACLVDEAPVLKVKPSMNFGRPFGSL